MDKFIQNHSDAQRDAMLERVVDLTEFFVKRVKSENINYKIEYNIRYAYIKKCPNKKSR